MVAMRTAEAEKVIVGLLSKIGAKTDPGSREELGASVSLAHMLVDKMNQIGAQLPLQLLDAIWSCAFSERWGVPRNDEDPSWWLEALGHVTYLHQEVNARIYGFTRDEFPRPLEDHETTNDLMIYLRPLFDVGRYPVVGSWGDRYRLSFRPDNYEPNLVTFEHAVNRVLRPPFRTVALGGPYDAFGMARVFPFGDWQSVVKDFLADASFILVYPSDTDGMRWELEQIRDLGLLNRTALVMMMKVDERIDTDPFFEGKRADIPHRWDEARSAVGNILNTALPEYESQGAFLFLNGRGQVDHRLPLWSYIDERFRDYVRERYGCEEAKSPKYNPKWRD